MPHTQHHVHGMLRKDQRVTLHIMQLMLSQGLAHLDEQMCPGAEALISEVGATTAVGAPELL